MGLGGREAGSNFSGKEYSQAFVVIVVAFVGRSLFLSCFKTLFFSACLPTLFEIRHLFS